MGNFAENRRPLFVERIGRLETAQILPATWRDSPSVCALADEQRHFGHIVSAGDCWVAFDATHFNEHGNGFRLLGSWTDIMDAKRAVERVLAIDYDRISTLQ